MNELNKLLEELKTYASLVNMRDKYAIYPLREAVRLADKIYPLIDEFVEKHYPYHGNLKEDKEIEFNIKVPGYFYNVGCLLEEVDFDEEYNLMIDDLVWSNITSSLESFMECYAPGREYYVTGRMGGWLVVKHNFTTWTLEKKYEPWDEAWGESWNDLGRKDKLQFLANYGFSAEYFINDIEELIFWWDFEKKLEEDKKSLCSEETAKEFVEFLKENYEEWFEEDLEVEVSLV